MARQLWVASDVVQGYAGSSFGSFTTAKTVIPATSLNTIRSNWWEVGRGLEIDVLGGIGTLVTTPGTITFQVMIGSAIAFTTGAIQLNATAHTNLPFWLKIFLTTRALGSGTTANLMGQAIVHGKMFCVTAGGTDDANSNSMILVPETAPAVGAGFDSTIDNIIDLFAAFSISDASNTVKVEQFFVKSLN